MYLYYRHLFYVLLVVFAVIVHTGAQIRKQRAQNCNYSVELYEYK